MRSTVTLAAVLALLVSVDLRGQRAPVDPPAPRDFTVDFETSAGRFALHVVRSWAPLGADRLFALVTSGYYDDTRFFRVVPDFGVQFGLSGTPARAQLWSGRRLASERVQRSNKRLFVAFAAGMGNDTRTTQLFINLKDNPVLDTQGVAPVGWVFEGADVVRRLYSGYHDGAEPAEPEQWRMHVEGNAYLAREFPKLDYVIRATVRR